MHTLRLMQRPTLTLRRARPWLRPRVLVSDEQICLLLVEHALLTLSRQQFQIVSLLLDHAASLVPSEHLLAVLGTPTTGRPPQRSRLYTLMCAIRARLSPYGLEVYTWQGRGYSLHAQALEAARTRRRSRSRHRRVSA